MLNFNSFLDKVKVFGYQVIAIIQSVGQGFGKKKSGQTLGSLRQTVTVNKETSVTLNVFGSEVFRYIENGRKPGSKLPPQGVLLDWMKSVGIPEDAEYGVRLNIARFGIEPKPLLANSFDKINSKFTKEMSKDMLGNLSSALAKAARDGFTFGTKEI